VPYSLTIQPTSTDSERVFFVADLTIKRLFLTVEKSDLINDEQLIARYKWGCDGFGGQIERKQKLRTQGLEVSSIVDP
jgi:hypothetical protein